jgi:DNA polymerase III epsilon subunit-like protein
MDSVIFPISKYRGLTFKEVYKMGDKSYINWIKKNIHIFRKEPSKQGVLNSFLQYCKKEDFVKIKNQKGGRKKQTNLLFIDTETSGLPKTKGYNQYYSPKDLDKYQTARIVQISWVVTDYKGNIISQHDYIIKPNNFIIPEDSIKIHGINNEKANKEGLQITSVLKNKLYPDLKTCNKIIGHNIFFDNNIIKSELYRNKMDYIVNEYEKKSLGCTMIMGKYFLKHYKNPKLTELFKLLFNKDIEGAHNSLVDTVSAMKCYFKIIELQDGYWPSKKNVYTV